jgi:hypothetical protein
MAVLVPAALVEEIVPEEGVEKVGVVEANDDRNHRTNLGPVEEVGAETADDV